MHRLRSSGETEQDARDDLHRKAKALSTGGSATLSPSSTIADVVELWLSQILTRVNIGSLSYSTYESYEVTARLVIVPRCGGVRLDQLTVGRCDRILQKVLEEESIFKARHARAVLSLLCGYAVRDDALDRNPVRDVQRLPTAPRKKSALTTPQIIGIRELMQQWRVTRDDGRALTIVPCLTVGGVFAAGMDDVLPAVGADVLFDPGHQSSQRVLGADNETKLLTGVEPQSNGQQIDLDLRDFAEREFLHPVERVGGNVVRSQGLVEVTSRDSLATIGALVLEVRGAVVGEVVDHRVVVRSGERSQRRSMCIELLHQNEHVHVVGLACFDEEARLRVADEHRFRVESGEKRHGCRVGSDGVIIGLRLVFAIVERDRCSAQPRANDCQG